MQLPPVIEEYEEHWTVEATNKKKWYDSPFWPWFSLAVAVLNVTSFVSRVSSEDAALSEALYDQTLSCMNMGEEDPLCGTSRDLTQGEKKMLRGIFGAELPVNDIRIRYFNNGREDGFVHPRISRTLVHINTASMEEWRYDEDFVRQHTGWTTDISKGTREQQHLLIHEVAHVMQGLGHLPYGSRADYKDPKRYEYTVTYGQTLRDFNNEQGADMVADFATEAMYGRELQAQAVRQFGKPFPTDCASLVKGMTPEDMQIGRGTFLNAYLRDDPLAQAVKADLPSAASFGAWQIDVAACHARLGQQFARAAYPQMFRTDPRRAAARVLADLDRAQRASTAALLKKL